MGLTLLQRPEGRNLKSTSFSISVSNSSGDALFTHASTILDNEWVYLETFIDNYNGFFKVDYISSTTFKIRDKYSDYIPYINSCVGTATRSASPHGVNSVYTPINYLLTSDLYPTNTVDTSRTVSSFTDDNGYLNLNLSGSLGTFQELDFIKISGASSEEVNGTFQVFDKYSTSDITINLAYDASYSFSGGTVILVYNNYNVVVEVYCGLSPDHYWQSQKTFELAGTLNLIPDSDNNIEFSVSEIVKGYIQTRNSATLGTLPNNLDFFTSFYIKYAESYDRSNAYSIATYQGSFFTDNPDNLTYDTSLFGVNAALEFKNQYSGWMNEYLIDGVNLGKFLTLFETPVLFDTNSFSVSFAFFPTELYKIDGQIAVNWLDQGTPATWSLTPCLVTLTVANPNSGYLYKPNEMISGVSYRFPYSIQVTGTFTGTIEFFAACIDASFSVGAGDVQQLFSTSTAGTFTGSVVLNGPDFYFGLRATSNISVGSAAIAVLSFGYSQSPIIFRTKKYLNGTLLSTSNDHLVNMSQGIYRQFIDYDPNYDEFKVSIVGATADTELMSDELTISLDQECYNNSITLEWLNNLGGFDQFVFTAYNENGVQIGNASETKNNVFVNWPKSFGAFADTMRKQTFRDSWRTVLVRSQYVTQDQLDAISYVKSSVLVQVVNSRTDKRTVIVDTDSFVKYADGDKTFSISFLISHTDNIPSQRL